MSLKTFILMVGAPGSGKTFYCQSKLGEYLYVIGKESERQLVDAFAQQHPLIVVDHTHHLRSERFKLIYEAKLNGYETRIIWLNTTFSLCESRLLTKISQSERLNVDISILLSQFFKDFETPSKEEADFLQIITEKERAKVQDLSDLKGSFLLVSDLHGMGEEFETLLEKVKTDYVIIAGDLTDRGKENLKILDLVMRRKDVFVLMGNHDHKLLRYLKGHKVQISHGLDTTISEFRNLREEDKIKYIEYLEKLPHIFILPLRHIVVHAGLNTSRSVYDQDVHECLYLRRIDQKNGKRLLSTEVGGEYWYNLPRVSEYENKFIFFGHTIYKDTSLVAENAISLDNGAVSGNGLRYVVLQDGNIFTIDKIPSRKIYEMLT